MEAEQESIKTSQSVIVNKNASLEGKVITLSSDIEKLEKSPNFITSINIQKVQEFSCKLCEHSFTSELELKQHLESIHPQALKCNICAQSSNVNFKAKTCKNGSKCSLTKCQYRHN